MAKYGLIPKSFLWIYALIPKSFVAKYGLIPKSLGCLPLRVTPSAKRNTYSVAMMVGGGWTQGSVLSPATLGWGNATPTALLLLVEAPSLTLPKGREC